MRPVMLILKVGFTTVTQGPVKRSVIADAQKQALATGKNVKLAYVSEFHLSIQFTDIDKLMKG